MVAFLKENKLYYLVSDRILADKSSLMKIKNFVESAGLEKAIYVKSYDIEFIVNDENELYLKNFVFYIEKMKAAGYPDDEINNLKEDLQLYTSDIEGLEEIVELYVNFREKGYAKDYGYVLSGKPLLFVYSMYEKGYKYDYIDKFRNYFLGPNALKIPEIIDTMTKNNYTVDEIKVLLDNICKTYCEIPSEFYLAAKKHVLIDSFDINFLNYAINANENTIAVLNELALKGISITELNENALKFIENPEYAQEFTAFMQKKDLNKEAVLKILNTDKLEDSKKISMMERIQSAYAFSDASAETLEWAGNLALYSCYGGPLIAITWPISAVIAITVVTVNVPFQLYYLPRYKKMEKL